MGFKFLFALLFEFVLLQFIKSGQIDGWDIELNYNNAGFMSEMIIPFKLENPITETDYVQIIMPTAINSQFDTVQMVPIDIKVQFGEVNGQYHCNPYVFHPINVWINYQDGDVETNAFYLQILDEQGGQIPLDANVFYVVQFIIIGSGNVNLQSPGAKAPIEFYTVSAIRKKAISYDRNPAFAPYALSQYPLDDLLIGITSTDPSSYKLRAEYNITIDVTPRQRVIGGGRIQFSFLGLGFKFISSCTSIEIVKANIIPPISRNQYTCQLDELRNIITVFITRTIGQYENMRFTMIVRNPDIVVEPQKMEIKNLELHSNQIIEFAQSNAFLRTDILTFDAHYMKLGWGMTYSETSGGFYPFNLMVLRADASAPTYYPYNGFQWHFRISDDLPSTVSFNIRVLVPNQLNSFLLPGSISYNLPKFNGTNPDCKLSTFTDPTSARIVCSNVGALFKNTTYSIRCRITFPFDTFTSALEPSFGVLQIFANDEKGVELPYPITVASNPMPVIETSNNPQWFITASPNFDYTMISTGAANSATTDPSASFLGTNPDAAGSLFRMTFTMNMVGTDIIGNPVITSGVPISGSAGLIILANGFQVSMDPADSPTLDCKTNANQKMSYQMKKHEFYNYLDLRITADNTDGILGAFASSPYNPVLNWFSVNNIRIKGQNSLYADEDLFDFYIGTIDQLNNPYPIFRRLMLYNAYTIYPTYPAGVRFGLANFWTSSNAYSVSNPSKLFLDGNYFPAFIRIAGTLGGMNAAEATKIAIFFTNLDPFWESDKPETNNTVSCSANWDPTLQCQYFPSDHQSNGQSYVNFDRIQITASFPITPMQILIPVKTMYNNVKIKFFIASLGDNPLYPGNPQLSKIIAAYRLNGGPTLTLNQFGLTATAAATYYPNWFATGISANNYGLNIVGLTIGKTNTDIVLKFGHTDAGTNCDKNSASDGVLNGGGITVVSSIRFDGPTSTYTSPTCSSSALDNQCIASRYVQSYTAGVPNIKEYLFCPNDLLANENSATVLTIQNGNAPFQNGGSVPSFTSFTWSDKTGNLKGFNGNTIGTIVGFGAITIKAMSNKILKNNNQQQVTYIFKTTNPVSSTNKIKVNFLASYPFDTESNGKKCKLKSITLGDFDHTCTMTRLLADPTFPSQTFEISNCPSCPIAAGDFQLTLWGIDMPNVNGVDVSFSIKLLAASLNVIDQSSTNGLLQYDNTGAQVQMSFKNLVPTFRNKRTRGEISFDFKTTSRYIGSGERVVIDFGGYGQDNGLNLDNMFCTIMQGQQISYRWLTFDLTQLYMAELIPQADIKTLNLLFTVKCYGVITPYSYNPLQVTGYLGIQNDIVVIQPGDVIALDTLFLDEKLFLKNRAFISLQRLNTIGSSTDFEFNITSDKVNITASSHIFIDFPSIYPPQLSNNLIFCSMNDISLDCKVDKPYRVHLTFLPQSVTAGTSFKIRVFGVQASARYYDDISDIMVGLTNNADLTIIQEYGMVKNDPPTPTPANVVVNKILISNPFIRSTSELTFLAQFPAASIDKNNAILIDFPFIWDIIINYKRPNCSVYDPNNSTNYAGKCINYGNRITIPITTNDYISRDYYYIKLVGLRNPDNVACDPTKWTISIASNEQSTVTARSHPSHFNMPYFVFYKNPKEINLIWNKNNSTDLGLITVYAGVFDCYLELQTDYGIFARKFQIYSEDKNFVIQPTKVEALLGLNRVRVGNH